MTAHGNRERGYLDAAVMAELTEMSPATAAAIADGIGQPVAQVSASLQRLRRLGLVEPDRYQRHPPVWVPTDRDDQAREK